MALTPEQKQALLAAASVVANETEPAANTANRIGTLFARIINALGDGNDINELKAMFLSKVSADTAAEIITFAKGLIAQMIATFNGGITVTNGASIDELEVGTDLTVRGDATVAGILRVITKLIVATLEATNITTTNLTVTGVAHFFQLVIDELTSNKGAIIITSANCKADVVVNGGTYYDVYFRATDADGAAIINSWKINDMAICMAFNGLHSGINNNVSNKYYWRKVTLVTSNVTRTDGYTYHRIRLSRSNFVGDSVPEAGDNIVQLGYMGSDDAARQSAIILSAYATPDQGNTTLGMRGLTPPSLAFYRGINTFELTRFRKTFVDAVGAEFYGNFHVGPNEEDIETFVGNRTKYMHIAWSNDPEDVDAENFSFSSSGQQWDYIGVCVTTSPTPPALPDNRTQYQWTYIRGAQGDPGNPGTPGSPGAPGSDAETWRLIPVERTLTALADGRVKVIMSYTVLHVKGTLSEVLDGNAMNDGGITASYRRELVSGSTSSYYPIQVGQDDTVIELSGTYAATNTTWNKDTLSGVRMRLVKGTTEVDADFVPLTLLAGAAFDVIQAGCDSYIQSHVQGTYALQSSLDATNQTVQNNQSTVTQRMDSITSRVQATETNYNTLSGNVNSIQTSVSQISQKADSIEMKVTQQSQENENYIRNASLASLPWIDREWTRMDTMATIRARIIGHIWRYTSATNSPKLSGDSYTCYCAILSSYITRAAGDVPSAATISQAVTVTSGNTYTMSIWARKRNYYGNVAFGIGEGNMTLVHAAAYNSSGAVDSSVTVDDDHDNYVQFVPTDDNWHLFVVVMQMTARDIAPWYRVWGNTGGSFADWLISRPCLRLGDGVGTTSEAIASRTYVNSSTNLFSNRTLSSTDIPKWRCSASVTVDGVAYGYSFNGTAVTNDKLTDFIFSRFWNTEQWPNSLLMGGSVAAVNFSAGTAARSSHSTDIQQEFSASLGTALYGKTLCFSAYIKRYKTWGGKAYNAGSSTAITTYGLGLKGTNISAISVYSADDTSVVTVSSPESFGSPVWKMCRFSPADDSWHRVWIVFTLNSSAASNGFKLGFHHNVAAGGVADDWVITKPKLEIGSAPTGWTDYTGDEIKSLLKEAGIDIDAQTVAIHGENIHLEGTVTANNGFWVDTDGLMGAKGGFFSGFIRTLPTFITEDNFRDMFVYGDDDDANATAIWPWLQLRSGAAIVEARLKNGASSRTLDLRKSGASIVFKHWNSYEFSATSLNIIHLPFIAHSYGSGSISFEGAFRRHQNGVPVSGAMTQQQLYREYARVRSFVGCTIEIYNVNGDDIPIIGLYNQYDCMDSQDPTGLAANTISSNQDMLWRPFMLESGKMLRLKCARMAQSTLFPANTNSAEVIYWYIEASGDGFTSAMFDFDESDIAKI